MGTLAREALKERRNVPETRARERAVVRKRVRKPHLDGIRGVAVLAVVAYHADGLLPGGFLGVDLFFVLSGYLITNLSMMRYDRKEPGEWVGFWKRRAKRLLPGVYVMVALVSMFMLFENVQKLADTRWQIVGALTYTSNWVQLAGQTNYFGRLNGAPVFEHLWSLAVEEQFYLVWPLVLSGLAVLFNWRDKHKAGKTRGAFVIVLTMAASSYLFMGVLAQSGEINQAYLNSFARFGALLLGAAAGLSGRLWETTRRSERQDALEQRAAGLNSGMLGLLSLCVLMLLWWKSQGENTGLYPMVFMIGGLAAVGLVASSEQPGVWQRVLGFKPFVWAGQRAYGIYLWHWPIWVLLAGSAWNSGVAKTAKILLALVAGEISWQLVEKPGLMTPWIKRQKLVLIGAVVLCLYCAVVAFSLPVNTDIADSLNKAADTNSGAQAPEQPDIKLDTSPSTGPSNTGKEQGRTVSVWPNMFEADAAAGGIKTNGPGLSNVFTSGGAVPHNENSVEEPTKQNRDLTGAHVYFIGDSVMLGAKTKIEEACRRLGCSAIVDAKVNRQASDAAKLIAEIPEDGSDKPLVVVHLGTNGDLSENTVKDLKRLGNTYNLYLVNMKGERSWQADVNQTLQGVCQDSQTGTGTGVIRCVDWNGPGEQNPDWFYTDGIHLQPAGQLGYANLLLTALQAL